jgi:glycosyltransferase involved in cell wall biosynthesis
MEQVLLVDDLGSVKGEKGTYSDLQTAQLDVLYQSLQSGKIPSNEQNRNPLQDLRITNVKDNYVFIRRFFSLVQIIYVLIARLLSFKNPLFEIYAFFNALFKSKRVSIEPQKYTDWDSFDSTLVQQSPLVSIIIPTLNRYEYLRDVFADLERQEYQNFEVIVVDQSEPVDVKFYEGWKLQIHLIQQEEKALWLARNSAIQSAKGNFIALTEDDVRLRPDWITEHLKCLDYFKTDISAGLFYPVNACKDVSQKGIPHFKLSHQFPTGNALLKRAVFEKCGLFDRQFEGQRMGDGEFGLRCLLNGFNIISNPMAFIIDIKAPMGGLRQMGSWDALRPKSLFAPRPVPSVLYLIRKYHGNQEALYYLIKNIPQSYMPYKFKKNKIMRLTYGLIFPLFLPIACVAVYQSWKLASIKIKQGSRIDKLN